MVFYIHSLCLPVENIEPTMAVAQIQPDSSQAETQVPSAAASDW